MVSITFGVEFMYMEVTTQYSSQHCFKMASNDFGCRVSEDGGLEGWFLVPHIL